ncbi:PREDICTED: diacylglycerol O-acyltransferase 2-like [Corvus brachyrhynchos]|uniref:diacylglycerol O-acyltransferase 2-like n=1 Tax=Corvus brachyrhynchos TaxID=85066 RepID=UPI000816349F|nr:PREDICTED: diacylglycerol O-acyltransferase 2-like [Corvus brachyrhynchos]
MKTIIAACSQNLSGSRASIQTALRTLLAVPWPSQRDVRSALQLLAVLQWVLSFLLLGTVSLLLLIYLLFTSLWLVPVLYLAWIIFDWDTPEKGGVAVSPLPPALQHDGAPRAGNFRLPVFREYLMSGGLCPVTRRAIGYLLAQKGTGNAVAIVIGGAAESLSCRPGVTTLILKNRKGFVRMALRHGAFLVPSFSFGENDLFRQVVFEEGSWMRSIQRRFQKIMGFAPCLFYGRGLTSGRSHGFLPFSRPITTVVGEPVAVPKVENPSRELVDRYHELYIHALLKLFKENKTKYGLSESDELHIL